MTLQPALDAMIGYWLDDPRRLVGPFANPDELENRQVHRILPDEVVDPLLSSPEGYDRLTTRTMLLASDHLDTLSDLVSRKAVPAQCHELLLNAIAVRRSKGTAPPLRVLLPEATLVDRVWDCQTRQYLDVKPPDVATFAPVDMKGRYEEPDPPECVELVRQAVETLDGDLVIDEGGAVDLEEGQLLIMTNEVGVSTWHGLQTGTTRDEIGRERWMKARREEKCMKD